MKALFVFIFSLPIIVLAQSNPSIGRVVFSSGGGSNSGMPVSMGEPFGGGSGFTVGSQQGGSPEGNGGNIRKIEEYSSISIYPNPTDNNLNVVVKDLTSKYFTVKILDVLGRELLIKYDNYNEVTLSLTNLNSGTYCVQLFNSNGNYFFNQTIIKN